MSSPAKAVVGTLTRAVKGLRFPQLFLLTVVLFVIDLLIPPGGIPLYISPGRIVLSVLLLLAAAVAGCAFSLRRVLRVDPASALGS